MKGNDGLRYVASSEELLFAIDTDRLHGRLAARLQRLIQDLAVNDLPLALLDLAQLHWILSGLDAEQLARLRSAPATAILDSLMRRWYLGRMTPTSATRACNGQARLAIRSVAGHIESPAVIS